MGSRHRPGTAPGPADDRPSTLRAPAGDPTPITQVKVCTRAKSITGFSLSKPNPGFKTGYRFSGSRLTSLIKINAHKYTADKAQLNTATTARMVYFQLVIFNKLLSFAVAAAGHVE